MTTSIVDTPAETSATDSVLRRSLFIGLIILVVTSVIALVGGIAWPAPKSGDWYGYADVAPIRDRWWIVLTLVAANAVLNQPIQALAAVTLCRRRGSTLALTGATLMWIGTALQAVAVAGWAATYYFATDPALNSTAATALLAHIKDDPRMMVLGVVGVLAVTVGTVLQAVGLLRARACRSGCRSSP